MTTRLSDIERTLLSAYRDGEVSAAEKLQAERLLAASSEAREYLGDLRSLNAIADSAFPPTTTIGTTGAGSKLTSGAIRSAANVSGRSVLAGGWALTSLAGAAVTAVAILSVSLSSGPEAGETPRRATGATGQAAVRADIVAVDLDAAALMIPAITDDELIDFAVTGRLPIDSTRERYLSVAQRRGQLAINTYDAPGPISFDLRRIVLGDVPGLDSLEREIRTSLLQSDGNGLCVRSDLPSLRLRVIEELQDAADDLPEDLRRTMSTTRAELEREYQRLHGELRSTRLDARRNASNGAVRYLVIAGTALPKGGDAGGTDLAITLSPGDDRVQTLEISNLDLGTLEARVESTRVAVARTAEPRPRAVTSTAKVSVRRPSPAPRASARRVVQEPPPTSVASIDSTTISFEEVQRMQSEGRTLDGVFNSTERWLNRAEQILRQADSIRSRIERLRLERLRAMPPPVNENLRIQDPNDDVALPPEE